MTICALASAEWIQLGATALAAFAAGASWVAVNQTRRAARRASLPHLHGQCTRVPFMWQSSKIQIKVHNSGGGLAKAPIAILVCDGSWGGGYLTDGFIEPGETVHAYWEFEQSWEAESKSAKGVLCCRDVDENSWVWDLPTGRRQLLRRNSRWTRLTKKRYNDDQDMIAAFSHDVKLNDMTRVRFTLPDTKHAPPES